MSFRKEKSHKCKYCDNPAKQIRDRHGRNKGYYRTCGADECIRANFQDPNVIKKKTHFGINNGKYLPIGTIVPVNDGKYQKIKLGEGNWIYLHIHIAQQKFGRLLEKNECVHHIDMNNANNDPENLIIMDAYDHIRLHGTVDKLMRDLIAMRVVVFEDGAYKIRR